MDVLASNEKDITPNDAEIAATDNANDKPELERPTEDAQRGVQNVEAVTLTWSKRSLVLVFILYFSPCLFGLSLPD